jgi:ribosomal protein L11 methyltransferase
VAPAGSALWRVLLSVRDADRAEAAARALDPVVESVSAFAAGEDWRVEGLARRKPDPAALAANLALQWRDRGEAPAVVIERLAGRDWLDENQKSFSPVAAGRFFIHPTSWRGRAPHGRTALRIDAATAFGTGEHGSTQGALLALDRLARRGRPFRRVLDMGCGTGILAMAASKTWRRPVALADIDPEAVRVAARNAAANALRPFLRPLCARSYRARALRRRAPYDLVLANILARPLMLMARDLAGALAPRGVAVLGGFLPWQESAVLAAHRLHRFVLVRRVLVAGWSTLILSRSRSTL